MRSLRLATVVSLFDGGSPKASTVLFRLLVRRRHRQQLFDSTQVDDLTHLHTLLVMPAEHNPDKTMGHTIDRAAADGHELSTRVAGPNEERANVLTVTLDMAGDSHSAATAPKLLVAGVEDLIAA